MKSRKENESQRVMKWEAKGTNAYFWWVNEEEVKAGQLCESRREHLVMEQT